MVSQTPGSAEFIVPEWQVPESIHAICTTRIGGYSAAPFDAFNLGLHVGDDLENVRLNREHLISTLQLPQAPSYLRQVHGTAVVRAENIPANQPDQKTEPQADACWTHKSGSPIAIMTADCLAVLFASACGNYIAGAHAGWRGLAAGVLEATVASLPVDAVELTAWLGPAIGPDHFEVGAEVREQFMNCDASSHEHFVPVDSKSAHGAEKKYTADIFGLARDRLRAVGVGSVCGGNLCTYSDSKTFFSHRRDSGQTGRMAAVIWKD